MEPDADPKGEHRERPRFVPDRRPLEGRSGREPPQWALITIVGVIILVIGIFSIEKMSHGAIRALLPFGNSDGFWITLIFLPMVALIVVAAASKLFELRKAQSWTATTGRVVRSGIEARRHRFEGEAETVENVPAVEYEFTVGGRKVHGSRIGIGDDSGGANTDATLKRYPLGAAVTVYYDPADPKNCVLERSGPQGVTAASLIEALALLVLFGACIYWLLTRGSAFVAAHFPKAEAELSVYVATFGLFALMFFIANRRYLKQAQSWPSVRGKIVASRVEEFQSRGEDTTTTMYRPAIEYAYSVRGRDYRGAQIKLGLAVEGTQTYASGVTAKYPEGADVEVHYDPANPGNAALENPAGASWYPLGVALASFAFAIWLLGVFR